MHIEEFFLEDRQVGVIQVELELQSAVGDPSAAAEQDKGLIEHGVKVTPHFPALLGQSPSPCDKTLARREGAPLNWRPSADAVAGNGRPLSWAPSADAVAGGGDMAACQIPKRSLKAIRGHHSRSLAKAP
jgi:hypothetical protein